MTPTELTSRVTARTALAAAALALGAAAFGGVAWALGVAAGGALAVLDFRALAARVTTAAGPGAAAGWLLGAGLRWGGFAAACAALFATGWANPVGLVAGLSVLPIAVVLSGLAAARAER